MLRVRAERQFHFLLILIGLVSYFCGFCNGKIMYAANHTAHELILKGNQEKNPVKQREYFQKALALEANNFVALNNIGSTYEAEKQFNQAEEYYQKAVTESQRQGKPYAMAFFGLGDLYQARGNVHKAYEAYREGLKINSNDKQALARLAEIKKNFATFFDSRGNFLFKDPDEIVKETNHASFRSLIPGEDLSEAKKAGRARDIIIQPRTNLTILFDYDSDRIRPESKPQLESLARAMTSSEMEDLSFFINGHTDSQGETDYNKTLSVKRAKSIKSFLEKTFSIPGSRLFEQGFGEEQLLVPLETSEDDFQKNRRAEVLVKGKIIK